jgi:serine/threonine protein kinase
MSPEHILGQPLDVRSDIFSFGVVLYEMFTGVKPFKDDDVRPVTAKIVKDAFLPPRRVNREIPRRLQWLIKKCLRKKPGRRYGSVLEVQKKLGRHLSSKTTKAGSLQRISDYLVSRNLFDAVPEQETLVSPLKGAQSNRLSAAFVSAALALLLLAGAAAYYYRTEVVSLFDHAPLILPAEPRITTKTTPTMQPKSREELSSSPSGTALPAPPSSSVTATTKNTSSQVNTATTPATTIEQKQKSPAQKSTEGTGTWKRKKKTTR